MTELILVFGVVALIADLWFIWCNQKACSQIQHLIEHDPKYSDKLKRVSYNQHFWYLLTFRDPMRLYDASERS